MLSSKTDILLRFSHFSTAYTLNTRALANTTDNRIKLVQLKQFRLHLSAILLICNHLSVSSLAFNHLSVFPFISITKTETKSSMNSDFYFLSAVQRNTAAQARKTASNFFLLCVSAADRRNVKSAFVVLAERTFCSAHNIRWIIGLQTTFDLIGWYTWNLWPSTRRTTGTIRCVDRQKLVSTSRRNAITQLIRRSIGRAQLQAKQMEKKTFQVYRNNTN